MRPLSKRTMANKVTMHKNNANESASTRTTTENDDKHKNNANDAAKHKNDAK